MGLPVRAGGKKTVHEVETYWLSGKDKVPGFTASKDGHTDSPLEHEKTWKDIFLLISKKKVQL